MDRDDKTWLHLCYLILGSLAAYVGYKLMEMVGIQFSLSDRFERWFSPLSYMVATLAGVGSIWWAQREVERREFYLAAIGEVRKVTWPTVPQTKQMTLIVCIVVAIFAVILAVFDVAWVKILQVIIH